VGLRHPGPTRQWQYCTGTRRGEEMREENMLRDIMSGGELGRQRGVLSIQIFIARRRFTPNFHGWPRPKRWNRHEFATHKNIRYYVCVVKRRFVL
jgi:hypothetical protein